MHRPPGDPLSVVDAGAYGLERIGELCLKLLRKCYADYKINFNIF